MRLPSHFTTKEFACKCAACAATKTDVEVDLRLMEGLEWLRAACGAHPIIILSGHRCAAHNADPAVGGAPNSMHLHLPVRAADILLPGFPASLLFEEARLIRVFHGIGYSRYRTSLHIDVRDSQVLALWSYDANGRIVPFAA